jgi:hypothetical protein
MTGQEKSVQVDLEPEKKPEREMNFLELLEEEKEEEKDLGFFDFLVSVEKRMRIKLDFATISKLAPELALPGISSLKNVKLGVCLFLRLFFFGIFLLSAIPYFFPLLFLR